MKILSFAVLSVFIIFINGCTNVDANRADISTDDELFNSMYINWDLDISAEGNIGMNFRVDEKLALDIGDAVLKSVYTDNVISRTDLKIYEIETDDIFIVSRILKNHSLGGDYNVAISKKNGAILKIWSGE